MLTFENVYHTHTTNIPSLNDGWHPARSRGTVLTHCVCVHPVCMVVGVRVGVAHIHAHLKLMCACTLARRINAHTVHADV